jgi:nitrate reductase (cytochrome), electron transfer subunit
MRRQSVEGLISIILMLPMILSAEDVHLGRDPLRRGIPLDEERRPLQMQRVENSDLRRKRAFPEQPPTIPHAIDNYQLDKNSNACLRCHSRANAENFQAPMISVTHYLNRDGQVLASIAPRRYFCTQCHTVQTDAKPLVGNQFRDVDELIDAR